MKEKNSSSTANQMTINLAEKIKFANLALNEKKYDISLSNFNEVILTDPNNALAVRGLAKSLRALKRNTEASNAFKRYTVLRPNDAAGHHDLAKSLAGGLEYGLAIDSLLTAKKIHPDRPFLDRDLGRYHLANSKAAEAEQYLQIHVGASPTDAEAHFDLGRSLIAQDGKWVPAEAAFRTAIFLNPELLSAQKELVKILRKTNRQIEAIEILKPILVNNPLDAVVNHDLSRIWMSLTNYENAIPLLKTAIKISPRRKDLHADLAKCFILLENYICAEKFIVNYLQENPTDISVKVQLIDLYYKTVRYNLALTECEKILNKNSNEISVLRRYFRILKDIDRVDDAVIVAQRIANLDLHNSSAHHDLGRLLSTLKRHEDALVAYTAATDIQPDRPKLWRDMGRTLINLGKFRDAEYLFKSKLTDSALNIQSMIELGRLYNIERRWEAAVDQFSAAIAHDTAPASANLGLGIALRKIGRLNEAKFQFDEVIVKDSSNVDAYFQLGEIAHLDGDLDKSLEHANNLLLKIPNHVNGLLLRAKIYFELGYLDSARMDIDNTLAQNPSNQRASQYKAIISKRAIGVASLPEVTLCVLGSILNQHDCEELREEIAEFIYLENKLDEEYDWRSAILKAKSDWIMLSNEIPTQAVINAFRRRASNRIGAVVLDMLTPESGVSIWRRAALHAWLRINLSCNLKESLRELSSHLRMRTLTREKTEHVISTYVRPEVDNSSREVWLVSSSGMQLFGGVEQFLRNMLPIYRSLGYEPIIVGLLESIEGKELAGEVDGIQFINLTRSTDAIMAEVIARRPIIAQGTTGIGYELVTALDGFNTRIIYGSHFWRDMFIGSDSYENIDLNGRPRAEFIQLCSSIDQGYANSQYTRDIISKHFGVAQPILYSLPFDLIDNKLEETSKYKGYVLLMNGRPDKGFDLLLKLAVRLPDVPFRVVAAQVSRERTEERIVAAGVSNVTIQDWTNDSSSLYRGARIVMVASYAFVETFSRVTIEAHRHGVPVLGSDRGNVPLLLEECGVSLPENEDIWSKEIDRLYNDDIYYDQRRKLAFQNSERYRFADQPARVERLVRAVNCRVAVAIGSGIGNMIQCSPVIRRMSEHFGRPIDIILNQDFPGCGVLFAGSPWVGQVYENAEMFSDIHFNVILVLDCFGTLVPQFNADTTLLARRKFDFDLTRDMHEARFNLLCAKEMLGVPFVEDDVSKYFVGAFDRGISIERRIGLHAGGKAGVWMAKRWPFYEELVPRLQQEGYEVVSFGSSAEYIPGTVDMTGTDLRTSILNIRSCSYFIANDSGIMHIADALNIPLSAIFGPTSVIKNGPLRPNSQVIGLSKPCSPCQFNRDIFDSCTCISEITLDEVESSVSRHFCATNSTADSRSDT